ncbi:CBM35 domain-containing protein [Cohnella sp. CFH 77786]|uniref:CBM35 domain-containing protein n=1 Tax=Cohnella sp. CFH 77786 TaxID=2662265 RepID=UPI001C60BA45|nr:CBM35 domain-containing protein [Cohnella sp. CFH 77786]
MKKKLCLSLSFSLLFLSVPFMTSSAAVPPQFTVDLSNQYRPVTHAASGSLYGLADEGRPADSLIGPTKPKMFTQMAPNGQQLPNGETAPTGDALKVSPIAKRNGASVTIRMPDIYPNFPYQWVSWADWYAKVDSIVNARLASGATNIYGYELWNEPDGTWNTSAAGSFNDGWKNTYLRIKTRDTTTKIIGPSITQYNETWLRNFLTYCRDNNVLPDIISWHELGAPEGHYVDNPQPGYIENHIAAYRALEASLGISPRPISINEYGVVREEGVPGSMVRYFAEFERSGVDTANAAFWFRPGRLSNIVTDAGSANGGWWLYKWYGDMTGNMAMTTPSNPTAVGLDGIASVDAGNRIAYVVFGGGSGDHTVVVKGFGSVPFFTGNVHVKLETTPWSGVDTAVAAPSTVFEGDFEIANGQISVPVTNMNPSSGYRLTLTSAAGSANNRYEAERALVNRANTFSNASASNGKYIGQIDFADSYVQFTVNVPAAGAYTVDVRYANGTSANSTHSLSVNGGAASTVTYPVTGGWLYTGNAATVTVNVNLNAGSNTIRFTKGATGYAELDYIQLTPAGSYKVRAEAENATLSRANVHTSAFASNRFFVGQIDYSDSYVEFTVNSPSAGTYTMEVGYANGTSGNSTHNLSVNGRAAGVVTYPATGGWLTAIPNLGTRKILTLPVTLNAGNNTIRFTKGTTGYAELDYIEIR